MTHFEAFEVNPANSSSDRSELVDSSQVNSSCADSSFEETPFAQQLRSVIHRKTATLKLSHQIEIESLNTKHQQMLAIKDRQTQQLLNQIAGLRQQVQELQTALNFQTRVVLDTKSAVEPGILSHIPTTYQVKKSPSLFFDRSMSSFQRFLLFTIIGLAVAGISAIALSYTTLWPIASHIISPVIPVVFVLALIAGVAIFLRELLEA